MVITRMKGFRKGVKMKGKIVKEYDHPKYPGFITRVSIGKNGNVSIKFLKKPEKKDVEKPVKKGVEKPVKKAINTAKK
jgi:hypothetical protein